MRFRTGVPYPRVVVATGSTRGRDTYGEFRPTPVHGFDGLHGRAEQKLQRAGALTVRTMHADVIVNVVDVRQRACSADAVDRVNQSREIAFDPAGPSQRSTGRTSRRSEEAVRTNPNAEFRPVLLKQGSLVHGTPPVGIQEF
jgi:hypothetical protein